MHSSDDKIEGLIEAGVVVRAEFATIAMMKIKE